MAKKVKAPEFNYVVARPWDDAEPNNLCIYAYGREVQRGTMANAQKFLEYVKCQEKINKEPKAKIDAYGIYVVGYTRIE